MRRLLLLLCVTAAAADLRAATFNIAAGDVAGLKSAITTANGNGQNDTIVLATGSSYVLTTSAGLASGLPAIGPDAGHSLTIQGNGATIARSSSANTPNFRIFYIQTGADLTLLSTQLTNGNPGNLHGGAIYEDGELGNVSLTLVDVVISGCSGDYGGAIFNDGYQDPSVGPHTATLTAFNSTFSSNVGTQYGGAIWNESGGIAMTLVNCSFTNNSATRSAGAVQFDASNGGTATGSMIHCTFSHNSAGNFGGAVSVDGSTGNAQLTIRNCTFDQNTAANGGGVASDGSGGNATIYLSSCTFSGNFSNTLGDAIYLSETTSGTTVLQIGNTILASGDADYNISTDNITGGTVTVISSGYNLSDDAACGVSPCGDAATGPGGLLNHAGDRRNTNPLLDPAGLKANGGPVQTIALQSNSPALDQGKSNTITATPLDSRNEPRPFDDPNVANAPGGDGSDIGAYEANVRTISSMRVVNDLQLKFTTILGRTYEVQSRPNLTSQNWSTVNNTVPAPPISGTGGVVTVTVPNAFAFSSAFYRLHQLP